MPFRLHPRGVTIAVRVTPAAPRNAVLGLVPTVDGAQALKLCVTAAPEDGKANKAVIALLAKTWDWPKNSLSVLTGDTHRHKTILAEGASAELRERLQTWLSSAFPAAV